MFAEKFNSLINLRGMSQKQIALETGITESEISKFISGVKTPKFNQLKDIAKILNVHPGAFFKNSTENEDFTMLPNTYVMGDYLLQINYEDPFSRLFMVNLYAQKDLIMENFETYLDLDNFDLHRTIYTIRGSGYSIVYNCHLFNLQYNKYNDIDREVIMANQIKSSKRIRDVTGNIQLNIEAGSIISFIYRGDYFKCKAHIMGDIIEAYGSARLKIAV